MNRLLLLCDCQYDYIFGSMSTVNSVTCIDKFVNDLYDTDINYYKVIVLSIDEHPINHISFKSWPIHCIKHSLGASIYDNAYMALQFYNKPICIFPRGFNANYDPESLLDDVDTRLSFLKLLRENKIEEIDILGASKSVLSLLQDMKKFKKDDLAHVLLDLCFSNDNNEKLKKYIKKENISCYETVS